jgi:outer membrane protein assembly factor BamB
MYFSSKTEIAASSVYSAVDDMRECAALEACDIFACLGARLSNLDEIVRFPGDTLMAVAANRNSRRSKSVAAIMLAVFAVASSAQAQKSTDWPTFGWDAQRTGYNPFETVLTTSNVPSLRMHWVTDLGGPILTQPTVAAGVNIKGVSTDVVYAATLEGSIFALNARTGAIIWRRDFVPVQTNCDDFAASGDKVGFIDTPTIDRAHNRIFIVSGRGALHSFDLSNGADTMTPVQIPDAPNFLRTFVYGSPTLVGTSLYIATASACDFRPYRGQVVRVSTTDGAILQRWFPTAANVDGGGIWGPGGVSALADGTYVFALTGNGFSNPENAGYAEHVVKLTSTLAVAQSHLPTTFPLPDRDFGATAMLFQPVGCPPMLAAYQKTGYLYIYNRAAISSGPMQTLILSQPTGETFGLPAYDHNRLYIAAPQDSPTNFNKHGLLALSVSNTCSLSLAWQQPVGSAAASGNPAISPVVANGVVYYADGVASQVYAMDARSGQILWSTDNLPTSDRVTGSILTSPTVVNGQLYVAGYGDHKLRAFGL